VIIFNQDKTKVNKTSQATAGTETERDKQKQQRHRKQKDGRKNLQIIIETLTNS